MSGTDAEPLTSRSVIRLREGAYVDWTQEVFHFSAGQTVGLVNKGHVRRNVGSDDTALSLLAQVGRRRRNIRLSAAFMFECARQVSRIDSDSRVPFHVRPNHA